MKLEIPEVERLPIENSFLKAVKIYGKRLGVVILTALLSFLFIYFVLLLYRSFLHGQSNEFSYAEFVSALTILILLIAAVAAILVFAPRFTQLQELSASLRKVEEEQAEREQAKDNWEEFKTAVRNAWDESKWELAKREAALEWLAAEMKRWQQEIEQASEQEEKEEEP